MLVIVKGITLLALTLGVFSLFSLKAPKGEAAMSGMANAAIASFLVEAVHHYITGDLAGITFLQEVGEVAGGMGGVAAATLVPISMGVNPVLAVVAGVAVGSYGILPGFFAGYVIGFLAPIIEKKLPDGVDVIVGALIIAPVARMVAFLMEPLVNMTLVRIGYAISEAAEQSPIVMGLLLGGIMKIVCTSPLSSMALTAMLGLTGPAMGIASIACVGGAFSNSVVFYRMKYGNMSNVIAVILEPLTQAPIITAHPLPVYASSFVGGALSGLSAAIFGIVNNAPGTASTIPGLLAPFAFNSPLKVVGAVIFAVAGGMIGGFLVAFVFQKGIDVESDKIINTDMIA